MCKDKARQIDSHGGRQVGRQTHKPCNERRPFAILHIHTRLNPLKACNFPQTHEVMLHKFFSLCSIKVSFNKFQNIKVLGFKLHQTFLLRQCFNNTLEKVLCVMIYGV